MKKKKKMKKRELTKIGTEVGETDFQIKREERTRGIEDNDEERTRGIEGSNEKFREYQFVSGIRFFFGAARSSDGTRASYGGDGGDVRRGKVFMSSSDRTGARLTWKASSLSDSQIPDILNEISRRIVKNKGPAVMKMQGFTEKGLKRKLALQTAFRKNLLSFSGSKGQTYMEKMPGGSSTYKS